MLSNIPSWVWYVLGGIALIAVIYAASQYLDAATALLPGGEGGG